MIEVTEPSEKTLRAIEELETRDNLLAGADLPDNVRLYLIDIGPTKPLTREQEEASGWKVQAGLWATCILPYSEKYFQDNPPKSENWFDQLKSAIEEGKAAEGELIIACLKWVTNIAKQYRNKGIEPSDLIQAGNEGLMRAVQKFDPTRRCKLSTYATWWIRSSITRTLNRTKHTVSLPVHTSEQSLRWSRAWGRLAQEFGREPTLVELSDEVGTNPGTIKAIQNASRKPRSLDVPIKEGSPLTIGDLTRDEDDNIDPEQMAQQTLVAEKVDEVLGKLSGRERAVLTLRFGLGGGQPHTLDEVGQVFEVTRERIRQIEDKALRKLRQPSRAQRLKEIIS